MSEVVITAARRTPIGRFLGGFAEVPATVLGTSAVGAALADAGLAPEEVDELIYGHARMAGCGPNPARQVAHAAGIPHSVPSYTVNKACGSGLKSVILGAQAIRLGEARVVVAGGMENMSRVPYLLERARSGYRLGHGELVDAMYRDGFMDPLSGMIMGETAEKLARRDGISRQAQDAYALESHRRAGAAWEAGRFTDEVVGVRATDARRKEHLVERDEHPRLDTTHDKLGKLRPVFSSDGTVTPGNSSGITDGAAALVLMAAEAARGSGHPILARLVAWTRVGVDPSIMGIAPVPALRALFERTGLAPEDIDLFELNEAFAAQVLSCLREMPLDRDRLNVNGGAIALGHPIGATGARILVTLVHEMRRRRARRGIATLCISGGQGLALLVERDGD
ncbi:MAG: thiolase family protein [Candidatus Krumholzibacteriia bacterium]